MKKIAITLGDPNGISPEITIKALNFLDLPKDKVILIANKKILDFYQEEYNLSLEKDYEILGPVSISGKHHNVLGIFGWGGIGYNDLLDKAKELYPEADAVINIIEDVSSFSVAIFYNNFGVDMSGLAIRYIDNTEDYSVNFTVNTSE